MTVVVASQTYVLTNHRLHKYHHNTSTISHSEVDTTAQVRSVFSTSRSKLRLDRTWTLTQHKCRRMNTWLQIYFRVPQPRLWLVQDVSGPLSIFSVPSQHFHRFGVARSTNRKSGEREICFLLSHSCSSPFACIWCSTTRECIIMTLQMTLHHGDGEA